MYNYQSEVAAIDNDANLDDSGKFQKKLHLFYTWQNMLGELKAAELALRKELASKAFPTPVEGSGNKLPLTDGWILQMDYPINRKVDEALLLNLKPQLLEHGIPVDDLVRYKPDLATGAYRKLTDEQRAEFDAVLEIKPGTPALEVKLPKR